MLKSNNYGLRTSNTRVVGASDKEVSIPLSDSVKFQLTPSEYFYITVRNGDQREFMKVTGTDGNKLLVERGVDGTKPTTFQKGSCISVEWNPSQLCEFVKNCVGNNKPVVDPQVICCSCDTCFEIDDGGHIIKVNGGDAC